MADFFTYRFSDADRKKLQTQLNLPISPYQDYKNFHAAVLEIIQAGTLPSTMIDLCTQVNALDLAENPVIILQNCPTILPDLTGLTSYVYAIIQPIKYLPR